MVSTDTLQNRLNAFATDLIAPKPEAGSLPVEDDNLAFGTHQPLQGDGQYHPLPGNLGEKLYTINPNPPAPGVGEPSDPFRWNG